MAPFDWTALLSTAPQIATAVAFGYFVIKLLDRQDRVNEKRDGEWRTFLQSARDVYVESISAVTHKIADLVTVVNTTHTLLQNHDSWQRSELVREHEERAATVVIAAEAVQVAATAAAEAVKAAAVLADAARISAQVSAMQTAALLAKD